MTSKARAASVAVLIATGCGASAANVRPGRGEALAPPKVSEKRASVHESPRAKAQVPRSGSSDTEAQTLSRAEQLYMSQLAAAGRDGRFAIDRQVAALRKAIMLYEQFIERARRRTDMKDAVKRSRERIEDARATIDFLLAAPSAKAF